MFNYPVELAPDYNDTILITLPDLPGAITFDDDEADAFGRAVSALETVLNAVMADRQGISDPALANGRPTVVQTLLRALKPSVYKARRARGWRRADLANAMRCDLQRIDCLLDLRRASTVAQLEQAMWVCGRRFDVARVDWRKA